MRHRGLPDRFLALLVVPCLAALPAGSSAARAEQTPSRRTPIVEAFSKNKDAVVSVTGKQVLAEANPFFDFWGTEMPWFGPRHYTAPFLGSGFVVDPRGYILSNDHVVRGALEVKVHLAGRTAPVAARIVAEDRAADMALLKIDADQPLPAVTLGRSDDLMIGETVLAIGNPFGYQYTLTEGIVSAIHRDLEVENLRFPNLIQISAPINPGNSGGPLLNVLGQVIGMNTAIRRAAQGIGFAIPVDDLRRNLPEMLRRHLEMEERVDLGLTVVEAGLTAAPAERDTGRESGSGTQPEPAPSAVVGSVQPGSAVERAGLRKGDVIKAVQGRNVSSALGFYLDLLERGEQNNLALVVRQGGASGKEMTVRLALQARPKPDPRRLAQRLFGIEVEAARGGPGRRTGQGVQTVVIRNVGQGSPAEGAHLEAGDILVAVDGQDVTGLEGLGRILEPIEPGRAVRFTLQRVYQSGFITRIESFEATLRAQGDAGREMEHI